MKFNELGRSMVEMLGVLAIIGVLSVGAIAGYSKAMMKYKLNKQAEQLNTLLGVAVKYGKSFNNIATSQNITNYFIKLNEIPTEMIKQNDSSHIYDIFGLSYYVYYYNTGNLGLFSYNSQKLNNSDMDICYNLVNVFKGYSNNLKYVQFGSISDNTDEQSSSFVQIFGDASCKKNIKCLNSLSVSDIHDICANLMTLQHWELFINIG